jgi:tRNA(Ile)-lysidine synthetase-like protein
MIQKNKNKYECCSNIPNQWNEFKDILENNAQEPIVMKDNNVHNIVKEFKKETNSIVKNNDNVCIVVSLSGGVDSNVCLHLLRQYYPNVEIVAVFINYNNRDESNTELKFVKKYCAVSGVKLFHRTINEISRKDCHLNGIREIYETATKEIRFNTYKQVSELFPNKETIVMMGHNKDDCFENIITNIISKHNYDNLSGTEKMSQIDDITFWRPLLDIQKKSIIEFAKTTNIPFLHDSTPKWSARGKIRDNVVRSLMSINEDAVNSYFTLEEYLSENNKIIMSHIFPTIMQKFYYNVNIIEGDFEENELLANKCIWSNIFKNDNFKTLFENNSISFKCVQQFVEYIERFQKKFKKMKHDNVFNNKTAFVLKNNIYANISRTRDNKIHISFHKN